MLEPLLVIPSKRGPKHGADLRHVVDAILYISHTGYQWRFLPEEFGPWTRVWSQFRQWSHNETWTRALSELHALSRTALGRKDPRPSMVVIDTHLARGASNGGATFHNQGGPYGRTNGAKRIVCVDVTGLPLCVRLSSPRRPRPAPSNRYLTTSPAPVMTNGWNSSSWTEALRHLPPRGCRQSSTTRFVGLDGTNHRATSTVPRCFALSATPGGSKWPTVILCDVVASHGALRTRQPQLPDGCTLPPSSKTFGQPRGTVRDAV